MVTDVSEFRYGNKTQEERVYLSPIKDLCTDEIVSYSISKASNNRLRGKTVGCIDKT